jgi:hypothetical protein
LVHIWYRIWSNFARFQTFWPDFSFVSTSGRQRGIKCIKHYKKSGSSGQIEGSNKFLRWAVPGIENLGYFGLFWAFLTCLCVFWALPTIREAWNVWNTISKVDFADKMRGQTSFYDERLTTLSIWGILAYFGALWPIYAFFGNFRSSERYIMYETLLETWHFWTKWGVKQVSTMSGSQHRVFGVFWRILGHFDLFMRFLGTSGHLRGI